MNCPRLADSPKGTSGRKSRVFGGEAPRKWHLSSFNWMRS